MMDSYVEYVDLLFTLLFTTMIRLEIYMYTYILL